MFTETDNNLFIPAPAGEKEPMRLYGVTTIMKKYRGYKDVPFHWFFDEPRTEKRPYIELCENYDPNDEMAAAFMREHVDELFTLDEAETAKAYLDQKYNGAGVTTIEEAELPVPYAHWGWSSCTNGTLGWCGILELYPRCEKAQCRRCRRNRDYPLLFRIAGYWVGSKKEGAKESEVKFDEEVFRYGVAKDYARYVVEGCRGFDLDGVAEIAKSDKKFADAIMEQIELQRREQLR